MSLKYRRLQQIKDENLVVELKLSDGSIIKGLITELDENDVCVDDGNSEKVINLLSIAEIDKKPNIKNAINTQLITAGLYRVQINEKWIIFNTSFSSSQVDWTKIVNNNFVSGSQISGEELNLYENEGDNEWFIRIRVMRIFPKEFIIGPGFHLLDKLNNYEIATIEKATNFIRAQLKLQNIRLATILDEDFRKRVISNQIITVIRYLLKEINTLRFITQIEDHNGAVVVKHYPNPDLRMGIDIVDKETGIYGTLGAIYKGMVLDFKTKKNLNTDVSGYLNQLSAYHMMTVENGGEVNGEKVRRSGIVPLSQEEGLSAQERLAGSASLVKDLIGRMRKAENIRDKRDILHGVYGKDFGRGANLDFEALADYIERVNNELNDNGDWKMGVIPVLGQEAVDEDILDVNLAERRFDEIKSLTANRHEWDEEDIHNNLVAFADRILKYKSTIAKQIQNISQDGWIIIPHFSR